MRRGDGNDTVSNFSITDTLYITSGAISSHYQSGNDYIVNIGSGSITFQNLGTAPIIPVLDSDGQMNILDFDVIYNDSSAATINGTSSADNILNIAATVAINAGGGNDSIYNYYGRYATINVGAGNDSIYNSGGNDVTINAGAGNDSIYNYGDRVTIDAGDGDDSIYNYWGHYATINAGAGNDSIYNSGARVTINAGDGNDSIYNSGERVTINAGAGNDSIYNSGDNDVTINAGDGNDSIYNYGDRVTIDAGDGDDSIYNSGGNDVTINTGDGNDSIYNSGARVTINAGDGNDSIYNSGARVTIDAGAGDDSIYAGGSYALIQYEDGDGNDTIRGYYSNDTIYIADGSDYSTLTSVTDVIVSIGNGSIRLQDAMGKTINITGGFLNDRGLSINNTAARTLLGGTSRADNIINTAQYVTIDGDAGNDVISLGSSAISNVIRYAIGDGNDTVYGFNNSDTINIIDGSSYKTVQSGNDMIVSVGSDSITLVDAADKTLNIAGGTYGSVGVSISTSTSSTVVNGTGGDDTIHNNNYSRITINAGAGNDSIYNGASKVTINAGAGNDSIYAGGSRIVIEYTDGDGIDIISGFYIDDILHLTSGTISSHYKSGDHYVINVGSGAVGFRNIGSTPIQVRDANGRLSALNFDGIYNSSSDTLVNGTSSADIVLNATNKVTIDAGVGDDSIYNYYGYYASINAGDGNDSIYNYYGYYASINAGDGNDSIYNDRGSDVTINAGDGNDTIRNDGYSASLNGGAGDDSISNHVSSSYTVTIRGGAGNDTLTGYNYSELYQYSNGDGHDVITNFNINDTLQLDGSYYSTMVSGSDMIVSVGSGSILLKDAASQSVKITGGVELGVSLSNSTANTVISGSGTNDLISNSGANVKVDAGGGSDSISNNGSYVSIRGGADNDTIRNFFGSNVTIEGNEGADVIWNYDSGESAALYGDAGNDYIRNYGSSATIDGGDGNDTIENSASNAIINAGSGADSIYNTGATVAIDGGAGNDTVNNLASNVTIAGGIGNDLISLGSGANQNMIRYAAGDGNDTVFGLNETDTIEIADGADFTTQRSGTDVIVSVNGGSLRLVNAFSKSVKITNGSEPDDGFNTVVNDEDYVWLSGTSGDDYIRNSGEHVTVQAGEGNDSIDGSEIHGEMFMFSSADGDDTISNFGAGDKLQITTGSIQTITAVDDNLLVTVRGERATGTITLLNTVRDRISIKDNIITYIGIIEDIINHKSDVSITGTDYDDYILTDGARVTVDAGEGDDLIENGGKKEVFVFGASDGNDTITNFGTDDSIKLKFGSIRSLTPRGADHILTVGDGNVEGTILLQNTADYNFITVDNMLAVDHVNRIYNSTSSVKVSGSDDVDWITNTASNVTIEAKGGDDTVTGSDLYGEMILVASNHGNDVIENFGKNDTLKSTAGKIVDVKKVGDDTLVSLKGSAFSGTVSLLGTADYNFKQSGNVLTVADIATLVNDSDRVKFSGTSKEDYMLNTGQYVTIQGNEGDDTITGSDEYGEWFLVASNHGNDVITNFGKNDTLKCTAGHIAGVKKVGADAVVSLKGAAFSGTVKLIGAGDYNFKQTGDILTVAAPVITIPSPGVNQKVVGTSNADYIVVSHQNATVDGKGGGDTIEGSNFGDRFQMSSAYGDNVILNFDDNDTLQMTAGQTMTWSEKGADVIVTLKGANYTGTVTLLDAAGKNFVKSNDGKYLFVDNDVETLENYSDKVKFVGTSKAERMINYGEKVTVEAKGGNDTIEGSDFYGELFNFSSADGNNVILNFGKNDSLQMTAGKTLDFATVGSDVVVTLKGATFTGVETLQGAAGLNFIKSDNGRVLYVEPEPDPIINGTDNVKVNGTAAKDYIINTGQGVSIASGAGDDTLEGSDLYGELFMASSADGHDTILNFGANDTLQMTAGQNMTWSTVGNDVVVTLKGAKFTGTMTLLDAAGMNFVKSTDGRYLVVDNGVNNIINGADNVKVSGTDGIDWIENAGINVSLESKGGNDTIVGSTFEELFLFSGADGDNLVKNFGVNDTLKCTAGSIDRVEKSGNDAIVRLKSGNLLSTITLEGAGQYDFDQSENVLTVKHINRIINRLDNKKVNGTSGADIIINTGENATIAPGMDNDTLTGSDEYGDVFALGSADGFNVITNFGYNDTLKITTGQAIGFSTVGTDVVVTLKGSAYTAFDTLKGAAGLNFRQVDKYTLVVDGVTEKRNDKDKMLVGGTEGRDYIINSGSGVTIQGSADDDTVEGSDEYGEMFQWSSAYGDDLIVNFHANDTLFMAGGKTLSFETVGADVVVTLKGAAYTGTVTLKDAAGLDFKKSSDGRYLTAAGVSTIVNYSNDAKVIGTSNNDYIVNTAGGVSIQTGAGDDTIEGSNFAETFLFSSAEGNNLLKNFGINDTLRMTAGQNLTWSTVGDDAIVTLKGAAYTGTVTLEGAGGYNFKKSGKNVLYVDVANKILNTADGVKVSGTSGADYITNVGQGATIESGGGNDTIEGSDLYGELYNFGSNGGDNVILNFGVNDTLQMTSGTLMSGAVEGDDYVVTLQGKSFTGTVTLKNAGAESFRVSSDGRTLRMKDVGSNVETSAMMPSTEGDYWFMTDEANDDAQPLNEILSTEAELNALGIDTKEESTWLSQTPFSGATFTRSTTPQKKLSSRAQAAMI